MPSKAWRSHISKRPPQSRYRSPAPPAIFSKFWGRFLKNCPHVGGGSGCRKADERGLTLKALSSIALLLCCSAALCSKLCCSYQGSSSSSSGTTTFG